MRFLRHTTAPNDPIRQKIDHLKDIGALEILPEDRDKPWDEQRLRRTAFGDLLAAKPPRKRHA